MRNFLLQTVRPILRRFGIYTQLHRMFFFFVSLTTTVRNLFYSYTTSTAPILLYHRVASIKHDPLYLAVTPARFEEHMSYLRDKYDVIPLKKLCERIESKRLQGKEAAVTFDDGYKDNLVNALPILEKYNIPATIFVTTGQIGRQASFDWDFKYEQEDRGDFLSQEEIKLLSDHPLITIGAHTHTHPRLANLSREEQIEELKKSKIILEEITGTEIDLFTYPFGGKYDVNRESKVAAQIAGFTYALASTQELAGGQASPFWVPRINMRDCSLKIFSRKLRGF